VKKFDLGVAKGAWVQSVTGGGPADTAGLRAGRGSATFQGESYRVGGDVITKVNGHAIGDADELSEVIARYRAGQTVTVTVHRDGSDKDVKVRLGERPAGSSASAP
jgi:S1-C subfamily serine protease